MTFNIKVPTLLIMINLFTELQRKRRWQGSAVHHNYGHSTQHVPTMSPCQEDPPKLAGEV